MFDGNKIIIGLVVFLALASAPFWITAASGGKGTRPELEYPTNPAQKQCVEDKAYMQAFHMDLLDKWRDAVVRDGYRVYVSRAHKTKHEMSLSKTCLSCHSDKTKFCDRCHDYSGVKPYCWDCHVTTRDAIRGDAKGGK